jgi:hypothetical protein
LHGSARGAVVGVADYGGKDRTVVGESNRGARYAAAAAPGISLPFFLPGRSRSDLFRRAGEPLALALFIPGRTGRTRLARKVFLPLVVVAPSGRLARVPLIGVAAVF